MRFRTLTILGSTGSIGSSTLDVVRQNRDRFGVFALAAGRNVDKLIQQIQEFAPEVVVLPESAGVNRLHAALSDSGRGGTFRVPELLSGPEALVQIAVSDRTDFVMS